MTKAKSMELLVEIEFLLLILTVLLLVMPKPDCGCCLFVAFSNGIKRFLRTLSRRIRKFLIDHGSLGEKGVGMTIKDSLNSKLVLAATNDDAERQVFSSMIRHLRNERRDLYSKEEWYKCLNVLDDTFEGGHYRGILAKSTVFGDRLINRLMLRVRYAQNDWNLHRELRWFAIDTMMCAAYGFDVRSHDDQTRPFIKYLDDLDVARLVEMTASRRPNRTLLKKPNSKGVEDFRRIGLTVIERLVKSLKFWRSESEDRVFLERFVKGNIGTKSNYRELAADIAFLLVLTGVESISCVLYVCLYFLATNPLKQYNMQLEIDRNVKSVEGPELVDLTKFAYVKAVVLETLRLYPARTVHSHVLKETIESMEKNRRIDVDVRAINMDPEDFPNPTCFEPERFFDPAVKLVFEHGAGIGVPSSGTSDFYVDIMTNFLISFFSKFTATKAMKTPFTFEHFNAALRQRHFFDKKDFHERPLYIGLSPINYKTTGLTSGIH